MILGDNRSGMVEYLDWAEEFGLAVVSVEYRLALRHVTRATTRMPKPGSCGQPFTPRNS